MSMDMLFEGTLIVLIAWCLDAAVGDPEWFPHPVRLMGRVVRRTEMVCLRLVADKRLAGTALGLFVPTVFFAVTWVFASAATGVLAALGAAISVYCIYACMATRCLAGEAHAVMRLLQHDDLTGARRQVARIVGRDTGCLSREDIVRAAVESVSENTVDGIVAPLFYAFIGGAPLAMAYRAVNTLDSMVGYKNERYRELGWFSARLDDAANCIPARLCLVLVPLAALFVKPKRAAAALRVGLRDCRKSESPNAGFPESCFAGALGVRLGGPSSYGGVAVEKPAIGSGDHVLSPEDIRNAVRLMWAVSFFCLAVFAVSSMILKSLYVKYI